MAIHKAVCAMHGIITDAHEISSWEFPPPTASAVPELEEPRDDGIACKQCSYVTRAVVKMQKHCRESHGWVNDWTVGGDMRIKTKIPRVFPWRENVQCQRLQRGGRGSMWFEVERSPPPSKRAAEENMLLDEHNTNQAGQHPVERRPRKRQRTVHKQQRPTRVTKSEGS
jgi:hypothetical protein